MQHFILHYVIILTLFVQTGCSNSQDDPGYMFGEAKQKTDYLHTPDMEYTGKESWFQEDSSCSKGSAIVLKRIIRKLFNQVDQLQPSELDDEYEYQSTISYEDYHNMLRFLNDDTPNCKSLLRLNSFLTNFISTSDIRRPSQAGLWKFDLRHIISQPFELTQPITYLATVLTLVGFTSWFLRTYAGYSNWGSNIVAVAMTGFIQFYLHRHLTHVNNHKNKIEECQNPSFIMKALSFFNYDYDSCHRLNSVNESTSHMTNIALAWVSYISELGVQPFMVLLTRFAEASQTFLNQFSGWNTILAPFILAFIVVVIFTFILKIIQSCLSYGKPLRRPSTSKKKRGRSRALPIKIDPIEGRKK